MKIKRQICTTWSKEQITILNKYNIDVKEDFECIYIEENEIYFELEPYFNKWDVFNVQGIEFSKEEILKADYCIITGCYEGGYPMPDDDFGYRELTYNMNIYCQSCGMIKVQKDAFRLKKVPKHKIFKLTWIWDEIFVQLDIYRNIFEPLGIKCKDVKLFKGDKVIPNIVQLIIPNTDEPLDLHEYSSQTCLTCGKIKYETKVNGFYPIQKNPLPHLYRSKEYFGDGCSSDRKIFISGKLRDILIREKIMRYYWFVPCVGTPLPPARADLQSVR